ncbi:hypothetical protein CC1G_09451 [Coprinopsis cinerea okayama7|uniref:Uncharacterized protein n=1 Tax=Coprinopsis cinerea (strain Okayama-7 / 130 / ATCC MYA-4618 / FGSC 9003) TaxID=240176 RepID=A8PDB6_COPC7|nr:hypothetical protein CC1G_09451 [Coprinopsis cinerea okayama7\|eukprot:XP_001840567.1 hypothetical protein CC1G_09451 [Coprinopsis cinerea okayama7\
MLLETTPLLQNLSPVEAQDLLNYASARLRHLAIAITTPHGLIDSDPGLKEKCWEQFKVDLNSTLILFGSMSLLHPGKVWAPVFLDHAHKLLINGGITSPQNVAEVALHRPLHGFDVFPPDAAQWWSPPLGATKCTPLNLSVTEIVEAWKKQEKRTTWYTAMPPMIPQGFQDWRLRPLHNAFTNVSEQLESLAKQLTVVKDSVDVFQIACAKFDGLLDMSLDGSEWKLEKWGPPISPPGSSWKWRLGDDGPPSSSSDSGDPDAEGPGECGVSSLGLETSTPDT